MDKFQTRSPLLIAAAMALAPALASAGETNQRQTTTTTTTTSAPPGSSPTTAPSPQGTSEQQQQGSAVLSPSTPPELTEADATRMRPMPVTDQSVIDPAQVQKVFGMDVALIDLKGLNRDQVKVLQQRLQERGFYRGKIDGAMGPQTRNALTGLMAQQYDLNQRLVNQGRITEQFASSIGVDTRGRAPVTGIDRSDVKRSEVQRNDQAVQHPAPHPNAQVTTPIPPNQ